jgi:hypothetical protein
MVIRDTTDPLVLPSGAQVCRVRAAPERSPRPRVSEISNVSRRGSVVVLRVAGPGSLTGETVLAPAAVGSAPRRIRRRTHTGDRVDRPEPGSSATCPPRCWSNCSKQASATPSSPTWSPQPCCRTTDSGTSRSSTPKRRHHAEPGVLLPHRTPGELAPALTPFVTAIGGWQRSA